jgi:hypothetical protein
LARASCGESAQKLPENFNNFIIWLLKSIIDYDKCRYYIYNTTSDKNKLFSKINKFLLHVNLSYIEDDGYVPIGYYAFLIPNNYHILTDMKLYDKVNNETHNSLYCLKSLGLIDINSHYIGKCRRVRITNLSNSIVGILSLGIRKPSVEEIQFNRGDISNSFRDYEYYEYYDLQNNKNSYRFTPNFNLVNNVISIILNQSINITSYIF